MFMYFASLVAQKKVKNIINSTTKQKYSYEIRVIIAIAKKSVQKISFLLWHNLKFAEEKKLYICCTLAQKIFHFFLWIYMYNTIA